MTCGVPARPLLALTAAVLALHLLALRASPGAVQLGDVVRAPVLVTRSIQAPMPPAPVVAAPVSEQKMPAARTSRAPAAINSIAIQQPPALPATQLPQPPEADPAPVAAPQAEAPATAAPVLRERGMQATAFAIPGSMRVRYQVQAQTRGGLWNATAELLWRHDGSSYDAKLEISMPFVTPRIQRSTGRITAEGLAPTRFSDKARSEEAAHFERDKGKVVFSTNRPEAPLLAGAQDRLSVLLQLGAMIAGEPAKYPPATTITVQTASTREADQWLFTVEGEEELQLPGGSVRALKLVRNPRREFDQKVELWLAPGMDYVPVRLRLTQANGDWLEQQWSATDRG